MSATGPVDESQQAAGAGGFRAVFDLEHERQRVRRDNLVDRDQRFGVLTRTRLVVDEHGFPLEVALEASRIDAGLEHGHLWVAPDGTVVRIDTRFRWRDAWIRLLHPSEY